MAITPLKAIGLGQVFIITANYFKNANPIALFYAPGLSNKPTLNDILFNKLNLSYYTYALSIGTRRNVFLRLMLRSKVKKP